MEQIEILTTERLKQAANIQQQIEKQTMDPEANKAELRQLRMTIREEEKSRIEKENWILNILKGAKLLSIDRKRQYYESSVRIMKLIRPEWKEPDDPDEIDLTDNFTAIFINLFAAFFEQLTTSYDFKVTIKQFIRPNNKTVVIDLIRYLINFTRDYFRQITLQSQMVVSQSEIRSLPTLEQPTTMVVGTTQNRPVDPEPQQQLVTFMVKPRRPQTTYELLMIEQPVGIFCRGKPQRINDYKERQQFAMTLFLKLKQKNQTIAFHIDAWRNSITGKKKSLPYDYNNLYTKEEIAKWQVEHISYPKPITVVKKVKEVQLKSYFKAFLQCELNRQMRPQGPKLPHKAYDQYIVLRYDHRYPLELVGSERKRVESMGSEIVAPKTLATNDKMESPIKHRQLKVLLDQASQGSQLVLTTQRKIQNISQKPCIVDRSKVLRVKKQGFLPEVITKSPSKPDTTNNLLDSEQDITKTQPYSSRSLRSFHQADRSLPNRDLDFRNIRAFTQNRPSESLTKGALEILRLMHISRNLI